jgi:hypothetical protein
MSEESHTHSEEPQNKPRRWRPWRPQRRKTRWSVFWAGGLVAALVAALVAIPLLLVNLYQLYPGVWEDLSSERRELTATLIGIVVALTVVIVLLAIGGASLGWTGFGNKTLWDWLQLLSALAIPVVLAAAGLWFTAQQDQRQQQTESQRAKAELQLAAQRAQDETLQAYLNQMSTLMLERELRHAEVGDEMQTVARARTLAALGRLDPSRKTALMEFITEAGLVQGSINEKALTKSTGRKDAAFEGVPVIGLSGADLSGADLSELGGGGGGVLIGDVGGPSYYYTGGSGMTDLSGADLSSADLSGADLRWAFLQYANLDHANLSNADLRHAYLRDANLSVANLEGATLADNKLRDANLESATMPDGQILKGGFEPDGPTFEEWRGDRRFSPLPGP